MYQLKMVIDNSTSYDLINNEKLLSRLDKFLSSNIINISRSRLQSLIKNGNVSVDDIIIKRPSFEVRPQSSVHIIIPPVVLTDLEPEAIPLNIIYENENVIVINKEPGMVVHPGAGHSKGTLVHAVLAHDPHMQGIGGELRPGIVHRLDKDTSGVILIAKNDKSLQWLQNQFKSRLTKKIYLALVDGIPPTAQGLVDAPIGRDPTHRQRMAVVPKEKGRSAQTQYRILEQFKKHTLLEVQPLTGRTHQIRVHLKFLGSPITGDQVYGNKTKSIEIKRFFLHAQRLTITLPFQKESQEFIAELPDDILATLTELRKNERIS